MKTLIGMFLVAVLLTACQKDLETSTARTNSILTTQSMNLAVSVDFVKNPESVTVKVYRYDSTATTLDLKDSLIYQIAPSANQFTRFRQNTSFMYEGTLRVKIVRDSTGQIPYDRWVTLTNRAGTVINNDTTSHAVSGYVGTCLVNDVVPKHY
jgi:hypothetical protein